MGGKSDLDLLSDAGLNLSEITTPDGSPGYQISGDTHPYRHMLREAKGRWDKMKRVWVFSGVDPTESLARGLQNQPKGLSENQAEKPHYWGHRERLRERFMAGDNNGFPDYELLELLLFQCIPRIDVKPIAKALIERFGSLAGVLAATPERLAEIDNLNYAAVVHLAALHETTRRVAREDIAKGPILSSWDKLITYLKTSMGHAKTERFQVLYLNVNNELIADEILQQGTVNHTPVYPREVIKRALELEATALIMVHNHPSGDPTPSKADISMTRELAEAGEKLDVMVHDHIIMSKHGHSSFRDMGLL